MNSKREEHQIENAYSQDEFKQRNQEFELWQKVVLEPIGVMQQQNFEVLIYEEKYRLNKSKREEVIPRYILVSPPYYWEDYEDEKFQQKTHNFELPFHYVVEQEATIQGIKMSRGVEPILITWQEIVILLRTNLMVTKGVPMVVRVR